MRKRLFALALGTVGLPVDSWAGRPLVVDDAGVVPPGSCELEAGVYFESHSDLRHYDVPFGVTCWIARSLEASLGFGGRIDEREEMF
ncbi:MAG: hypothetical protein H7Y43_02670, partial [Akkermansiaceae bacterium]|nr:hypothetical protein [Verrucomicrobiales bacterium]